MQLNFFSVRRIARLMVRWGALVVVSAIALAPLATPAASAFPGRYLMAFSASITNTQTSKYTYMAYSDDGVSWNSVTQFTNYRAGVPDLVIRDNTVFIYNPDPDQVIRYDIATATTSQSPVVVWKSDGSTDDFGDVSTYLDPATDKIVLFYKSTAGYVGDPQYATNCPERSATEVEGSNGAEFLMDDGDRLTAGDMARKGDTGMFFDGTRYLLYVGRNAQQQGDFPKVYVYTSDTLRGIYTPLMTLTNGILTECGSVPQGYYDAATSNYWTFITVLSPNVPAIIRRAVHRDFSRPLTTADFTTVLTGSNYPGLGPAYSVEGPGIVLNTTSNTPPGALGAVSASDGTYTNKVRVSWSASSAATSYEVWRNTNNSSDSAEKISSPDPTGTNYDDPSAARGVTYYYWVKAVNASDTSAFSTSDIGFLGVVGPLITANGRVGNVDLASGEPVTIAVQMMNIEPYLEVEVDWWIVALANDTWYYLNNSIRWTPFDGHLSHCYPVYWGGLFNLSAREVLTMPGLSVGSYTFWFAVDYPMDGILDPNGQMLFDKVTVTVP